MKDRGGVMQITIDTVLSNFRGKDRTCRIKLLGDSITHGVGGTGFSQNGEPIVDGFARNPDGYCWANLLRHHLEQSGKYTVVNNACTGTTIEFVISNFDVLVDADDDLILCAIGTNNRHQLFSDGRSEKNRARHAGFVLQKY